MAESSIAGRKRVWPDDAGTGYNHVREEEDDNSVRWVEDQRLRRMLLHATADMDIPLPSPTQHPALPTARSSTTPSSRVPRKRPCRAHRSAPEASGNSTGSTTQSTANGQSIGTSGNASSSAPQLAQCELDDLLDRATRTFHIRSPLSTSRTRPSSSIATNAKRPPANSAVLKDKGYIVNSPSRPRVKEQADGKSWKRVLSGESAGAASLTHTSSDTSVGFSAGTTSSTSVMTSTTNSTSTSTIRTPSIITPPIEPSSSSRSQFPRVSSTKLPTGPTPTNHTRVPPRIGLRSNSSNSSSSSTNTNTTHPSLSKPFKPPSLHPVRSSPRRPVPRTIYDPSTTNSTSSTHRGTNISTPSKRIQPPHHSSHSSHSSSNHSSTRSMRPPSRPLQSNIPQPRAQFTRPMLPRDGSSPVADDKMPSSDGVGNESFDSFDGMFAEGGDDVEALLKAIDGADRQGGGGRR